MDHMFIMRLAALLFGGGIASCLFPAGCFIQTQFQAQACRKTAARVDMPLVLTGGGSVSGKSFPYVFFSKVMAKAARKSPTLPSRQHGRGQLISIRYVLQFPCSWRLPSARSNHRQTVDGTSTLHPDSLVSSMT